MAPLLGLPGAPGTPRRTDPRNLSGVPPEARPAFPSRRASRASLRGTPAVLRVGCAPQHGCGFPSYGTKEGMTGKPERCLLRSFALEFVRRACMAVLRSFAMSTSPSQPHLVPSLRRNPNSCILTSGAASAAMMLQPRLPPRPPYAPDAARSGMSPRPLASVMPLFGGPLRRGRSHTLGSVWCLSHFSLVVRVASCNFPT